MTKKKLIVQGLAIQIEQIKQDDYISLTDIAKQSNTRASELIRYWLKNADTLEFLQVWEEVHNPDFKGGQMAAFRMKATLNRGLVTPKQYIKETNAIGIISYPGRYGGTYAHSDIALEFCGWISAGFKVYMIKEFQRLKKEEADIKGLEWTIEKLLQSNQDTSVLLQSLQKRLGNVLSNNKD